MGTRRKWRSIPTSQLITAVEVLAGNAPDAEQALEVVEASEAATDCQVVEVLGDCAYGAGETRAEFAAAGRTLIAKVPDLQNQGYFAKTDFQIDLEAGTCHLPEPADRPVTSERPRVAVACSCLPPRPVRRVRCGPSARAVRAVGRCRSTRRKPCSSKRARSRRVQRLLSSAAGARWWSIASRAWCSWAFARPRYWADQDLVPGVSGAVANLTLLAATSLASARTEDLASCWLTLVVVGGVLSTFGLAATHSHQAAHSSHLLHTMLPTISRQLPPSRPGS